MRLGRVEIVQKAGPVPGRGDGGAIVLVRQDRRPRRGNARQKTSGRMPEEGAENRQSSHGPGRSGATFRRIAESLYLFP